MASSKKKSKPIPVKGPGYRVFMSNFASYARENGIHVTGGRGSFAKKAGEVWHDLKAKPAWKDNLDVILPQYLERYESEKPIVIAPQSRLVDVIEEFSANQYEWWNIKNLYGLWVQSVNVFPEKDRLIIEFVDLDEDSIELETDADAFQLYLSYRAMPENNDSSTASYLRYDSAEINESGGIDLTFISETSEGEMKSLGAKTSFEWSKPVREKYQLQKEAVGTKGADKIAGSKIKLRSTVRREVREASKPEDIGRTQASIKKLDELNKAVEKLETQFERGLITKTEYKKYLNKLYRM